MDYTYYEKITIVPLNILIYNLFNSHGGPSLYGTEPWNFYLKNGLLNFNIGIIFAFASIPLALLKSKRTPLFHLIHFYLWLTIFSLQPHKEERFLYVIYPLICFNASIGLFYASRLVDTKWWKSLVVRSFFTIFILLAVSRISALIIYYRAPLVLYQNLNHDLTTISYSREVNICVGSEWYRFPSHYFLPLGSRLRFIKSDFDGQLPKYFKENIPHFNGTLHLKDYGRMLTSSKRMTHTIPLGMNDMNHQDSSSIFSGKCDFKISLEPVELQNCVRFLVGSSNPGVGKSFFYSLKGLNWSFYCYQKL